MNGSIVISKLSGLATSSSSFFRKISAPVWRILSFSLADDTIYPAKVVSASLEKGYLSVAYGSRFLSRITLRGIRGYAFEEGRYPQPEVFASSLSLALNDFGAAKADIVLGIPKAWAIIKTVEFPATVRENLSEVVSFELDRITPFSADDAFFDYKVLSDDGSRISLLVTAAKADLIRPYLEALKEKGISPARLTVNLSGIHTLCRYRDRGTDAIFLEVRKDGYEGALFMNGFETRAFSGTFGMEDEHKKSEAIAREITLLADYMKKGGKSARVIMLCRDKSASLQEMLKVTMNQPLTLLNEMDLKFHHTAEHGEIPYAAAGGMLESLWPHAHGLNLLQKGIHRQKSSPKALTMILLAAIAAMLILYLIAPLRIEEKRLQEIDRQIMMRKDEIRKIEALKKEIEGINSEISTIDNFKANRPMALNIVKELTIILPKTAWLSRLRVTETTVEIEGYATSATGILSKLEASSLFKKAEFASPTFRDIRMNADRFNIKMEIEGINTEEAKTKKDTDEEEE